jgi:hypothetical protein
MTSPISNQSGFITLDYIFAIVLVFGFTAILFSLTLTLTTAEITQYMAYSAARNYHAAHIRPSEQERTANEKYQQLLNHPVIAPLFKNGWFEVPEEITPQDYSDLYPEDPLLSSIYIGVRVDFVANMLDFEIPFYGSTTNDKTSSEGFKATLTSYLGREPSINECIFNFVKDRWKKIRQLDNRYNQFTKESGYAEIIDNGC